MGWLEGSWGGLVSGWRIHGVGGWLFGSWGDFVCGCVGGWRVHRVGAYTHPPMNSYNVKILIL